MSIKIISVIGLSLIGGVIVYINRPKKVRYEIIVQYWKDGNVVHEENLSENYRNNKA